MAPTDPPVPGTVVLLHAHPDDEAIFTGITMRRLADRGVRVVLVTATPGDLGNARTDLPPGPRLARHRISELERAAARLGVARLVVLDHRDSGMHGSIDNEHPDSFARTDPQAAARALADLLTAEGASTLIHYDSDGIYGHPDHLQVHRVGAAAARLAGVAAYQATVDREHLHFTPQHLVTDDRPPRHQHDLGRATAEISLAVRARPDELAVKAAAMLDHESQIGPASVDFGGFAESYGYEWFVHTAGPATLHPLGNEHLTAGPEPRRFSR
jgi:LmbE family N-acetylglucosaminyl deacetylase